jgi:type II secretory pathway component PulF
MTDSVYRYKILTKEGKTQQGDLHIQGPQDLNAFLVNANHRVLRLSPKRSKPAWRWIPARIPWAVLSTFTRTLYSLLKAHVLLWDALTLLGEEDPSPLPRGTLSKLCQHLKAGQTFSQALEAFPRLFPPFYRAAIKMTEHHDLTAGLEGLNRLLNQVLKTQRQMRKILTYPLFVFVLMTGLGGFLSLTVVPQLITFLAQSGKTPEGFLSVFLFLQTHTLVWQGILLTLLIGGVGIGMGSFLSSPLQKRLHALWLRIPWVGIILKYYYTVTVLQYLSVLHGGGRDVPQALSQIANFSRNRVIADSLRQATTHVTQGDSLAQVFGTLTWMPPMVAGLIRKSQASGDLGDTLQAATLLVNDRLEILLERFVKVLEPASLCFVAFYMIALIQTVFMPFYEALGSLP